MEIRRRTFPLLGDLPLAAIDASVLRSYSAALLSRVESSTAEVVWSHLSSILTSAVDDKRLPHNPIKTSRSVKPPRAGKRKAGAWTRSTVGMEYSGLADANDEVVIRGDLDGREFIAFWMRDGRVQAGMNVNVWDVTDPIQALIRSKATVVPRSA